MMQTYPHNRQTGFSIVELMVALGLSMTLAVAVVSVFVNNSYSFKQDENVSRMQDDVTADANLAIGSDCGPAGELNWMYRTVEAGGGEAHSLMAIDNATNAAVAAAHSCFAAGELLEGTDVVAIKRVAGAESAALRPGSVYLRTNGTVGLMYRAPFPAAPTVVVAPPMADWEYRPSIEYGIDTTQDGHPNVYMTSPSLADIQNVVSARIFILARTTDIDTRYTNDKTYSISNAPDFTPGDSFHRRVFSTNVSIQNIRTLNMMGF